MSMFEEERGDFAVSVGNGSGFFHLDIYTGYCTHMSRYIRV